MVSMLSYIYIYMCVCVCVCVYIKSKHLITDSFCHLGKAL